jgi:hypothetical protein
VAPKDKTVTKAEENQKSNTAQSQSRLERLTMRLRDRLQLPEDVVPDGELLKVTEGSLSRAVIELSMAFEDFGISIKEETSNARKWMIDRTSNFLFGA